MAVYPYKYFSFLIILVSIQFRITLSDSYYTYEDRGGGDGGRARRYVAEPISRLADTFADHSGRTTKDIGKGELTGGLEKHRAEFIGNLAVEGVEAPLGEQSPGAGGLASSPSQPVPITSPTSTTTHKTTDVSLDTPEKTLKKPSDKFPKKATEVEKATLKPGGDSTSASKTDDSISSPAAEMSGDFPKDVTNSTLLKHNITQNRSDDHAYYTSEFISGEKIAQHYWVDLENEKGVTVNEMLSKSHRRAATVRLTFDFPFYGHTVRNMTVATGGFLYTGDYIHSWLAATQYIAPLMANFDTSMSDDSFVKYRDNGTSFTVEWSRVALQDKKEAGKFSFQVTLHQNGDIVFVYKSIPILVEEIEDTLHPVKVGLSDAYIIDKTVFYIRKKTIYEYHRVSFSRDDIRNWTVIYMKALPTCVSLRDCYSCVNHNTSFNCKWCEAIGRCSSGYDRFLQEWSSSRCPEYSVSEGQHCSRSARQRDAGSLAPSVEAHSNVDESRETRLGHSGILGFLLVSTLVVCLGLGVFHAYRNPHTKVGQLLIRVRRQSGKSEYVVSSGYERWMETNSGKGGAENWTDLVQSQEAGWRQR